MAMSSPAWQPGRSTIFIALQHYSVELLMLDLCVCVHFGSSCVCTMLHSAAAADDDVDDDVSQMMYDAVIELSCSNE